MLKVRSVSRRSHYITLDSGDEVEVMFEPCDWMGIHVEQVGTSLVVAYNVHDSDPSNPMENGDCNGDIYTKSSRYGGGVITDNDSELYEALRVDGYGNVRSRDDVCTIDGHQATLAEHAADYFMKHEGGYDLAIEWMDETGFEHDGEDENLAVSLYDRIWNDLVEYRFKEEEIDKLIVELFKQNWREIVGPYVVPLSHFSERGDTSFSVTDWDGDPDDLPTGVWVACKCAIENIDCNPLPYGVEVSYDYGTKGWNATGKPSWKVTGPNGIDQRFEDHKAAFEFAHTLGEGDIAWQARCYAKGIVEEYAEWCNGNVYGCVVETFENVGTEEEPEWEQTHEDACWGFIGSEYAQQALVDEFFKPALAGVQPE